jgi:hypothetical protein
MHLMMLVRARGYQFSGERRADAEDRSTLDPSLTPFGNPIACKSDTSTRHEHRRDRQTLGIGLAQMAVRNRQKNYWLVSDIRVALSTRVAIK